MVPNRTRNDRSPSLVDRRTRSVVHWPSRLDNCIDSLVLEMLELDCSSKPDKNIAPMLNWHWPDWSSCPVVNELDRRN